jgi:autotransporter-associated beta strand protein
LLHHHGQGRAVFDTVIANDGANRVNLVLAGSGTTVLAGDNTFTGDVFLNNGVLQVAGDAQLGQVNGSIARIVLVGPGSGYTNTQSNVTATLLGGGGTGAAATFNTGTGVVSAINLTNGGAGYTSGVQVVLDGTAAGNNAGAWAVLDSGNLRFNGGVLHATESFALNSGRTIFLGGNGGTLRVDPGKTLTIDGFISGDYSHVSAANGYSTAVGLGPLWEAASVRNPDIGDLTIDGGGTVVFRYAPLGDGVTPSNVAHAYGGITWINDGILRLEGVGTTGVVGALGTHRSFLDSTVIGAGGTLDMFFTASDPSIQEWFTLRGTGYQGGGTFASTVPGTARTYNLAGQIHVEQDATFNIRNAHNFYINNGGGDLFGEGSITYTGNGSLRLYGNNPEWKGELRAASGTTYLASAANLQGLVGLQLQRNAIFYYSAGSTTVDEFRDRLPDDLPIFTNGWTRMRMDATGGVHSGLEKVGVLTVQSGVMGIEYNLGADILANQPRMAGDWAGWHFGEIIRQPGTTVALRNLDAGTDFGGAAFGTSFEETGDRALLLVDSAPVAIGGDGSFYNQNIVPGFFGGTRELWFNTAGTGNLFTEEGSSRHLVTLEAAAHPITGAPVNILRPLRPDEYRAFGSDGDVNLATPDSTALDGAEATGQNIALVGRTGDGLGGTTFTARRNSTLTLGADETVNSVSFMTDTFVNGTGGSRGNVATLLLHDLATLTVSSGVLNFANLGVQDMNGAAHNTGTNADIRSFIVGGRLDFAGNEAILHANSRWIHYNTSDALNAYREVDVDNTQVFINSSITNTGGNGLTKTGPNSVYLQVANSYTGDTSVNHGLLFARHNQALGASTRVNVSGSGGFGVGLGVDISGVDVHIGQINSNAAVFLGEQGSIFRGNIIVDNVDLAGATAYTRNFTPRIYNNSTSIFTLTGDIYGGATPIAAGIRATESRMFSTYTGAQGIFNLRGRIMDTADGPLGALVTEANQNQVLRMEILDTTSENNIQLWQPYESAGRIRLLRGILRYMGDGNFYSDAAIAAINPDNAMSGFQMGGRGVANTAGTGAVNLALVLANAGSTFNLPSWEVGVESTDRDNISGNDNFNRGNTTGNRTLAGENRSGTVTFGTGEGAVTFVNDERFGGYDAPLQLYAAEGGRVDLRAALLDGGDGVNSSVTKSGRGEVRLLGSSLGDSTVEAVNVLGGFLLLEGYEVHASRRVGAGAGLVLGGGGLVLNAGATPFTEEFGAVRVNPGGSAVVAIGAGNLELGGGFSRVSGGQAHFQSIAGGTLRATGLAANSRIGSWATYGASLSTAPFASDWAATDADGEIVAFGGYTADGFGPGNHTDVVSAELAGGATASLRFNAAAGSVTSGSVTLSDGGLLVTSNYAGGTPIGAGVDLSSGSGDLIIHNFAAGDVTLAGNLGGGAVAFNGTGRTVLTGSNSYGGTTFVTGAATLAVESLGSIASSSGLHLNGGTVEITGAAVTETWTKPVLLGGNDGGIHIAEADSRLILRAAAVNQITSEANPVASITTSPFNGGLKITGAGTVQFGNRSAADNVQDLLGVNNDYTGYTVLGDGILPLRIDIQGQVNSNGQINPFGTHAGWTDATLVRNNTTVEFGVRRGDGSRNGQVRVREWFEWGESAADVVSILVSTQREVPLEGINRVNGTLQVILQNQNYADMGTNGANAQTALYFGLNEGGLEGAGKIVVNPQPNASNSYGTLQIRDSSPDFTGILRCPLVISPSTALATPRAPVPRRSCSAARVPPMGIAPMSAS